MTLLQFALVLFVYNGDDGGTVKIHEIQFNTMAACEAAKEDFQKESGAAMTKEFEGRRDRFSFCIDRGE